MADDTTARPAPVDLRTAHCGRAVCGMHPEHLWTDHDGGPVRCPGRHPG